jgi:hypothetical protein
MAVVEGTPSGRSQDAFGDGRGAAGARKDTGLIPPEPTATMHSWRKRVRDANSSVK